MTPYSDLPKNAFWSKAVQSVDPGFPGPVYQPKFSFDRQAAIATAGSCFAQHIARHLRAERFSVMDVEPAPNGFTGPVAERFGYGMYSARYGNVYTVRQLCQILQETGQPADPDIYVWEKDGRYFDAFRPNVEPDGLGSREEVVAHREAHLRAVAGLLRKIDVFVFTLGLTETWMHRESGTVFPTAPGVIAGAYDPDQYVFKNFTHSEIIRDLTQARKFLKRRRPDLKIILTVSPVPLIATASGNHVLPATQYSKGTLRSAAGEFAEQHDDVAYFPSYEIITNPAARSAFYLPNLREIHPDGVASVMRTFLAAHMDDAMSPASAPRARDQLEEEESATEQGDVVCEEMLLDAFARGGENRHAG